MTEVKHALIISYFEDQRGSRKLVLSAVVSGGITGAVGGGHWLSPTFLGLLSQDAACTRRGAFGHVDDVLAFHLGRHTSSLHCRQARPLISWLTYD